MYVPARASHVHNYSSAICVEQTLSGYLKAISAPNSYQIIINLVREDYQNILSICQVSNYGTLYIEFWKRPPT